MLTSSFVNTTGTLAAGVAAQICAAPNSVCSQLIIVNTGPGGGTGGMVVKIGSAPASVLDGIPIVAGYSLTLTAEQVSQTDAVFGLSPTGTTYHCAQGVAVVART